MRLRYGEPLTEELSRRQPASAPISPLGPNQASPPDGVSLTLTVQGTSPIRVYTRDAAIRPNKPDRLRADFSLLTLFLRTRQTNTPS